MSKYHLERMQRIRRSGKDWNQPSPPAPGRPMKFTDSQFTHSHLPEPPPPAPSSERRSPIRRPSPSPQPGGEGWGEGMPASEQPCMNTSLLPNEPISSQLLPPQSPGSWSRAFFFGAPISDPASLSLAPPGGRARGEGMPASERPCMNTPFLPNEPILCQLLRLQSPASWPRAFFIGAPI